jgi:hypothetical protein
MQVVCEATQNPSVAVQVGAFECLVRIMALYYDKMAFYMEQALFGVSRYPLRRVLVAHFALAYCCGHETCR